MAYKQYTKCDFCRYYVGKTCTARPNSWYCKEATNEFYQYLSELKNKRAQK